MSSAPCGTRGGYARHLYVGELPCDDCRQANRRYHEQRRRAAGKKPVDEVRAERRARAERENPCGTHPAYDRHLRAGEEPCDPCRVANTRYYAHLRLHRSIGNAATADGPGSSDE